MGVIHMETDLARDTALAFEKNVGDMHDLVIVLWSQFYKLNWQGTSRDEFMNEFERVTNNITLKTEEGLALSLRLMKEVDEWEKVDLEFKSSYSEYQEAIKRSGETRQRLSDAQDELISAKEEYEAALKRLYENEGMQNIKEIQDFLKQAGITNPFLVDYWSFHLYILKRLGDTTILGMIDLLKKLGEQKDLNTINFFDLVVFAADESKNPIKEPVSVLGNIWESIKESFYIGDAVGGAIVLDVKKKAYLEAIDNYMKAEQAHQQAWDEIVRLAPGK